MTATPARIELRKVLVASALVAVLAERKNISAP